MTLAKVGVGQPLRISAETYNAFVDAAAAHQANRTSRSADGGATVPIAGIVLVRNDSGSVQERFAVLGLGDPLILPSENTQAFQERVAFSAEAPDQERHAQRFAILQEPIAAGAVGRAMVAGVTPVRLTGGTTEDEQAAVATGITSSLAVGSESGARILWAEPGTSERWGIVQFPAGGAAGGAPNLVLSLNQANHGWQVGDVLRWSGSAWIFADAGATGASDLLGVVGRIPDADTALLVLWGICCLDGLEPHTDYWLDPAVPGSVTAMKPGEGARLVLHHAQDRLCVVRAGAAGSGGGGADRFADLTDVDVTSISPADRQAPVWNAAAQRWRPRHVVLADTTAAHRVLAGPPSGLDALPLFRDLEIGDLAAVPATSVMANPGGAAARPQALSAATDDRALLRVAGSLQWLPIPTAVIADGAVTDAKIAEVAWGKIIGRPAQFPPIDHGHALGGDITGTTNDARIADGVVTDAKLVSVSWSKLTGIPAFFPPAFHDHTIAGELTGTLGDARIAANAVGTAKLADGAVTNAKLQRDFLRIGAIDWHLGETVTNVLANPMTGAGDLIVGGASGAPLRLPGNPGGTTEVLLARNGSTRFLPHTLDQLEDVVIASPVTGDVLTYHAAANQWRNQPAAGGGGHGWHPAMVGRVFAKVSGNLYSITLYPDYPSLASSWVTNATQLQGDTARTIPADTWTIACGVRKPGQSGTGPEHYDFFIQIPVWM